MFAESVESEIWLSAAPPTAHLCHVNVQETRVMVNKKVFKPSVQAIWNRYKTKYSTNGGQKLPDDDIEVEDDAAVE